MAGAPVDMGETHDSYAAPRGSRPNPSELVDETELLRLASLILK